LITRSGETVNYSKKILLISPNFAVGWTGHLFAAGSVIRSLQSSLSHNNVTLESLREVLTHPETYDLGSGEVRLIGWVIDAHGQHCFLWNSLYPRELYLEASHCDGSGALTALALVGTKGLHSNSPTEHDEDSLGALRVTTQLMGLEFWGTSTAQWGFGFAYEILQLVNGTHFKYLDNALYIPIDCELDEHGRYICSNYYASTIKYKAHDNYSGFYVFNPIAKSQNIYCVPPPGPEPVQSDRVVEDLRQKILNNTHSFPFESDYYCVSLRLRSPVFETSNALVVMSKHDADQFNGFRINIVNTAIEVNITGKWVEWFYETVRLAEDKKKGTSP
jgi:hypothetical protein